MQDNNLNKNNIGKKEDNLDDDVEKYKIQLEKDIKVHRENISSYDKWNLKINELKVNVKEAFNETKTITDKFNEDISKKIDTLEEEEKRVVLNRQKGINMINRMSQNVLNNIIDRDLKIEENELLKETLKEEIEGKTKEEIKDMIYRNYSVISRVSKIRNSLINVYFSFIQINILPIIDGIQSGITFIKNSDRKIVKEDIVPVYIKLEKVFNDFLDKCNIQKIDINEKDKIDVRFTEILEVEYTKDKELDETVESVIRNGYEYLEDIYNDGHNYILRNVQIIANKTE